MQWLAMLAYREKVPSLILCGVSMFSSVPAWGFSKVLWLHPTVHDMSWRLVQGLPCLRPMMKMKWLMYGWMDFKSLVCELLLKLCLLDLIWASFRGCCKKARWDGISESSLIWASPGGCCEKARWDGISEPRPGLGLDVVHCDLMSCMFVNPG